MCPLATLDSVHQSRLRQTCAHAGRERRPGTMSKSYSPTAAVIRTCMPDNNENAVVARKLFKLADVMLVRGIPEHIRSDNGPEFIAEELRCIRSTPTEMQSTNENDFECFASPSVSTPRTMFPNWGCSESQLSPKPTSGQRR